MSYMPNARMRILDCASSVFAEKSFDGSRISDIAKKANVPNSLIYYHFKSKEEILEVLIQDFLNSYSELIDIVKHDENEDKKEEISNKLNNYYFEFVCKNENVLRILLFESLKPDQSSNPPIFRLVEDLLKHDDMSNKDSDERYIAEFFTNIMPIIAYQCFEKQWCQHFSITEDNMSKIFRQVLAETHGAFHNNRIEEKNNNEN